MNIVVLVKQVPGSTNVEIDPKTGTLRRDGVASKMNPYDLFSIELALRVREQTGGTVTAVTMGPPQAAGVIREAVFMGCDTGYVLSDRKFAGADVLATSRTIARGLEIAAKREGIPSFDLFFCGKQTTDGDTAQVGPEVAERLGVPHVSNVLSVEKITSDGITLTADMGDAEQTVRLPLPALLTVDKDVNTPRLPSVRRKYELAEGGKSEDLVHILTFADYDDPDADRYGLSGSPTQVERIFPPEVNRDKETVTGSAEELSARLVAELREAKRI